jgi:hypothetical protein
MMAQPSTRARELAQRAALASDTKAITAIAHEIDAMTEDRVLTMMAVLEDTGIVLQQLLDSLETVMKKLRQ